MNSDALLALISDLYLQIRELQRRNAELETENQKLRFNQSGVEKEGTDAWRTAFISQRDA